VATFLVFLVLLLVFALGIALDQLIKRKREAFIRETLLPPGLLDRLSPLHPSLSLKDRQLVARGLRKFFITAVRARGQPVAMPSRVVGDLWRLFSDDRERYRHYSRKATGRVLPWTPAAGFSDDATRNAALRRCWWQACKEENLDPRQPTRMPLLFALDAKLKIAGGFYYFVNDHVRQRKFTERDDDDGSGWTWERERSWTSDDFQDTSYDGGTDGFGDSGGGDGGGDGGGGGD
jgi:hypothetical protein